MLKDEPVTEEKQAASGKIAYIAAQAGNFAHFAG
jgi:hypothetical protein